VPCVRHTDACHSQGAQRNGDVVLAIADEGKGAGDAAAGTGLSIVRALVRDELLGSFDLAGGRAEVVFPA
jgi:two-component sensor histidine kinase